ncbi:beta-1 adrenergic receptor-like [Dreissena polymorpha]|uniref:G-protein coupled receptors family 1 profile domain-containing protein n=1 Tax=Dreissena polymorpha TaxID=45954 RepID=A0A9D4RWV0_DREPO|nr:beta-1 adrenergic receptor-like [Dreissena polymorpha]KAH3881773.1 hypothetical protein DPMN_005700 [Dreissena polymorpha]
MSTAKRQMQIQTDFPQSESAIVGLDTRSDYINDTTFLVTHMNGSVKYNVASIYLSSDVIVADVSETARGITLVIFVALGIAFNIFMIVSIFPNKRLHTVRNILLLHLGCTGLCFSVLINLTTTAVSFSGRWIGGVVVCQIYGFLFSVFALVTSWTIMALSWDKYQTIVCPLHHSFTAKAFKLSVIFISVWVTACLVSFPPLLSSIRYEFQPEKGICFVCTKSTAGKIYMCAFLLTAVYIPLGIMVFCYTHIYKIARSQSSRIAATMIQMTCIVQATVAPHSNPSMSLKGSKAMCTIFQLIGSFVLVYIPMSVILTIDIIVPNTQATNVVLLSTVVLIFLSAPVINSCVYGLRNKCLRMSFRRYIRRKIRYYCYKDKRRNSVKSFRSFRSSSLKNGNKRQTNQNCTRVTGGLRRTQSFPVRGTRGTLRNFREAVNKSRGNHLEVFDTTDAIARPYSYNALNPEISINRISPASSVCNSIKPDTSLVRFQIEDEVERLPEDIPDIDAD